MKLQNLCLLFSCVAFCLLVGDVYGRNVRDYICNQKFTGYKIDYARRKCKKVHERACVNPFPYTTLRQCRKDFYGKGNICDISSPCRHGGTCVPVTIVKKGRTFKCDCIATGYYGRRCQRRCPKKLSKRYSKQTACIMI